MNSADLQLNLHPVLPELLMVAATAAVMILDMFNRKGRTPTKAALPWVALVGVLVTAAASIWLIGQPVSSFQGMAINDTRAQALNLVVLAGAALTILLSIRYIPNVNRQTGEYYALILLVSAGMMAMGSATDLMALFLALETFSLGLYILAGLNRTDLRSNEAAMKYFLLGAFASAFFVYGAAYIYGATGSTRFDLIANALFDGKADPSLLAIGVTLLIAGFGFKVSLVPFHMWTPDVYQGSPTPVTAFMSVGTKAAAFAAFYRLFAFALPSEQATWGPVLGALAILTMTLGNLAALRQSSLKRLLAYSSIAHAGYILVGLATATSAGIDGALFYLISYAFMNMGAFAVIILLERQGEMDALGNRLNGLAQRHPQVAMLMSIFMFSLAGVPPFAGFFGKFFVFAAAVSGGYSWLAAVAMLNSAIGAYYYLRIVVNMYFAEPTEETRIEPQQASIPLAFALGISAVFTVALGVLPSLWTNLVQSGALNLVAMR
ncbi:MAG: NADH-quinone oxidoreductase subunit N [Caldilinea sp.]|nr:NADH-quinone oxidoreductase subunit N [Caldilinea sp.]MDW8441731.1 NADH-quinone oxidoreductase subunit N [Caldilineaceae bacterium]